MPAPPRTRGVCLTIALAALGLSSACVDHPVKPVEQDSVSVGGPIVDGLPSARQLDILFVIDDSSSMAEEQAALAKSFASFIDVLEHEGCSFDPLDYRIAITTTNNGNPWCGSTTPEAGALQLGSCRERLADFVLGPLLDVSAEACTDVCPPEWSNIATLPTAIEGGEELRPRPWLESNGGQLNLPEGLSMAQALQCIGPQGIGGCDFEAPLESMRKAIGRSQIDDDPAFGFLRPAATLLVVLVTDEVDCSYNGAWDSIFLPSEERTFWSDLDAESPTSAVCWNAGVACEGASPYDDCHAVDLDVEGNPVPEGDADALAVLHPMSRYIEVLQELEDRKREIFPNQEVLVAVLGGVNSDGSVTYEDGPPGSEVQRSYGIGFGCESESGSAVPPVRLRTLAEAFAVGGQHNMFSICNADYSPALESLAGSLIDRITPACVPRCVADTDPSTPDVLDFSCTLVEGTPTDEGDFVHQEVPQCEPDAVIPEGHDACYVALTGDARNDTCIDLGFNLELRLVRRDCTYPHAGGSYEATCELSLDWATDCPELG